MHPHITQRDKTPVTSYVYPRQCTGGPSCMGGRTPHRYGKCLWLWMYGRAQQPDPTFFCVYGGPVIARPHHWASSSGGVVREHTHLRFVTDSVGIDRVAHLLQCGTAPVCYRCALKLACL
jgi:hypothetical protein